MENFDPTEDDQSLSPSSSSSGNSSDCHSETSSKSQSMSPSPNQKKKHHLKNTRVEIIAESTVFIRESCISSSPKM